MSASSISDTEELNAIASLTDADNPVLIVTDGMVIYYIIGDTAYVTPNHAQHCPETVGGFDLPADEMFIAEIE